MEQDERIEELAKYISEVTKKHTFEVALRTAITYIDGYNTIYSELPKIPLEDFFIALAGYDRRFNDGFMKHKIPVKNSQIREGVAYIGRKQAKEIKDEGLGGLFISINEGLF